MSYASYPNPRFHLRASESPDAGVHSGGAFTSQRNSLCYLRASFRWRPVCGPGRSCLRAGSRPEGVASCATLFASIPMGVIHLRPSFRSGIGIVFTWGGFAWGFRGARTRDVLCKWASLVWDVSERRSW